MTGWGAAEWGTMASWVTAIASVTACIAGFIGLSTWRTQDIWKADKDLSRRILLAVSQYENALRVALNGGAKDPAWSRVGEARAELLPLMQEARAVWNHSFPADLVSQLLTAERRMLNDDTSVVKADSDRLAEIHRMFQDIEALLRRKLAARR